MISNLANINYKRRAYTIPDYYLDYLDSIDKETPYEVSYKTYRDIVTAYFLYIQSELIDQSHLFKLPHRLGTLLIVKKLPKSFDSKSLRVDFAESKKQGITIYHINEHSNYYKYRLHWGKKEGMFTNRQRYQFVLTREIKRRLAQIIKNKEHDYTEI